MKKLLKQMLHKATRQDYTVVLTMKSLGRTRDTDVFSEEYIRLSTLELAVREIIDRGIAGAAAEVGVYRGDFAKHLNRLLPDRDLYLFDTFCGFEEQNIAHELQNGSAVKHDDFTNTSVELVLSKMQHPQKVRVLKGLFPATTEGIADSTFALVSLDCDLENPILAGLEYFYPRLSAGGYIFVHDYNNALYRGVKSAVNKFCRENGVFPVPLTDSCGTAVICKPAATKL
ncbi:MAG: TylF/MycF/NovP-related O-methyltransferase [Verrucomicrobiota bacterium]